MGNADPELYLFLSVLFAVCGCCSISHCIGNYLCQKSSWVCSGLVLYLQTVTRGFGVWQLSWTETHTNLSCVEVLYLINYYALSSECSLLKEGHSEVALSMIRYKIYSKHQSSEGKKIKIHMYLVRWGQISTILLNSGPAFFILVVIWMQFINEKGALTSKKRLNTTQCRTGCKL